VISAAIRPTLEFRVKDVDIYDYVRFSVVSPRVMKKHTYQGLDLKQNEPTSGQMSCLAFLHRFTKVATVQLTGKWRSRRYPKREAT
jgi:hypothetical protein